LRSCPDIGLGEAATSGSIDGVHRCTGEVRMSDDDQQRFQAAANQEFMSIRTSVVKIDEKLVYMHAAEYSAYQLGKITQLLERLTVAVERLADAKASPK